VIFKPIEIVDFRRQLKEFGLPERTIQHLSAVALDFREEMFVGADDVIETINGGGRAQESLVFASARGQPRPAHFLCVAQEMSESQILGAELGQGRHQADHLTVYKQ
jgi:hypothetical protein